MSEKKKKMYVMVDSEKAIFLVTGEPRETRISLVWYLTFPIVPLHGLFRSVPTLDSHGRVYTAKELSEYYVVLAIPIVPEDTKKIAEDWRGKRVIVVGYPKDEVVMW